MDGFGSSCVIARAGNSESRERMRGRKGRSSSTSFSIYRCFFTFKWPIGVSMSVTTGLTCHNNSQTLTSSWAPWKVFYYFSFFFPFFNVLIILKKAVVPYYNVLSSSLTCNHEVSVERYILLLSSTNKHINEGEKNS